MFRGGFAWLNAVQNISGERQWKRKEIEIEHSRILKRNESALIWEKGIAGLFDNPWNQFIVAAFTRYNFLHTNFILELLQLVQGNKWTDVKYNKV